MSQYLSTTIPYVNGAPHIGHALEFVLADVMKRYYGDVYFQSGADENSLKNVLAAEAAGVRTEKYVEARSNEFQRLTRTLGLELTDFIRTSSDPRHRPFVERIWNACLRSGDIYEAEYKGLYCVGCEQFYTESELEDGRCPEHQVEPEVVSEKNYFFRLTRYREKLAELISSREINIEPRSKRNEVLAFLRDLTDDLSISRSAERAHGWGPQVPDDPGQVIYVWIDALANYVSAPGEQRWAAFDTVTHVVGQGVLRFHAVYWPAVLLSAGIRLPSNIFFHNYVTVDGQKIGKSLGNAINPEEPVRALGLDAFRYFLLRHVGCYRDGDFSWQRYRKVYERELANQLGNLVSRVAKLTRLHEALPEPRHGLHRDLDERVRANVEKFALQRAVDEIWKAVDETNAYISAEEPWKRRGEAQASVLGVAVDALKTIARALEPFLPDTAGKILRSLAGEMHDQLFPRKSF